ncbi:sodium-coupled monocarboxylate transporter 1-like [Patiria miniata]|uniref:Sodium-coupled monocarboxylate transporter 1 n=1 Tax=Patiria miniata TaxID=46514 RepID=A0A913ZL75_PATMI|nr:sodium-coupled monocarboxylate transporter 1-like [Patiria miniata]
MESPPGEKHVFQAADYAVCGAMLLASLGIGLYYGLRGGRQRTSAEYVLADRSMTVIPVTLSLLASYFSGVSLQGIPSDVYFRGTMGMWAAAPVCISGIVSLFFFVPMYYNMGITSVFEYLEVRFNKAVLACGVFAFIFFAILYMGLVTFAASLAATAVTDVSYAVAVVCLVGVCTIYTVIGGIKAVLWTDTLQMLIIIATIIIVIIKGSVELGGIENVWRIAEEGRRIQFLNISPDPTEYYTIWGLVIGQLGTAATIHISNQYMVQRYLTCKSVTVAKTALVSFIVGSTIFTFLCVLGGVTIYAYYADCDPKSQGLIEAQDEILPYFITEVFRGAPGVAGILLAGIFGAALSTLSSVLNGVAALLGEHLIKPCWKTLSDERYTLILKVIATVFALITFGMAFLMPLIGSVTPTMFVISGATNGPVLALFLLGAFYPRCGGKAAFFSFVVGTGFGIWIGIGNILHGGSASAELPLSTEECVEMNMSMGTMATDTMTTNDGFWTTGEPVEDSGPFFGPLYSVSRVWYPTMTCVLSILVGVITTLIFGGNDQGTVETRLHAAVPDCCYCAWPYKRRRSGPPTKGEAYDPEDNDVTFVSSISVKKRQMEPPGLLVEDYDYDTKL